MGDVDAATRDAARLLRALIAVSPLASASRLEVMAIEDDDPDELPTYCLIDEDGPVIVGLDDEADADLLCALVLNAPAVLAALERIEAERDRLAAGLAYVANWCVHSPVHQSCGPCRARAVLAVSDTPTGDAT